MLPRPLKGIIPPVITPMLDNDTLDLNGLNNLLNRMIDGGVAGVFMLGTSGEAQNLSYNLRKELIKQTCKIVNGRVAVLIGITDTSFSESLLLAQVAADCDADALVSAPPYYYAPGQAELIQYYTDLADKVSLPLYLYNMPSHVKVIIEPSTVLELANHPNIIGLKDSSANGVYFQKLLYLLRDKPEFTLLVGPEEITSEIVLSGGHGGVNGGANLFPKLYVDLYNASVNRDFEKIAELQAKVMEISLALYNIGKYASSYIKGIKTALNLMGVCSDYMGEPFHKFKEAEREIVRKELQKLNIDL